MKILLTGHTSFVLMKQFYPLLQATLPEAEIAVYGLNKPGGELTAADKAHFGQLLAPPIIAASTVKKSLFSGKWLFAKGQPKPWKSIGKKLLTLQIRPAYQLLAQWVEQHQKEQALKEIFAPFDIINIHYCVPGFLQQLDYVQDHQKVMLSFWGSDLFQEAGVAAYTAQLQALERAHAITLHTPEMEQIFLSKFGRHFKHKLHQTIFGCHQERLEAIDQLQQQPEKIQAFKEKYNLPNNKTIVQIGYSGGPGHQHVAVIEALTQQAAHLKEELFLVIPTTYNNADTTYASLLKTTLKNSIFDHAHLTEYLTEEEILLLPIVVDVHINVRDADALNNAMVEAFYAGCWLILGAWLPYGILRRMGFKYSEIVQLSEIPKLLSNNQLAPSFEDCTQNAKVATEKITMHHCIPKWAAVYKKLYQSL